MFTNIANCRSLSGFIFAFIMFLFSLLDTYIYYWEKENFIISIKIQRLPLKFKNIYYYRKKLNTYEYIRINVDKMKKTKLS